MSVPTNENCLSLAAVAFGGKHMQELGQIRVRVVPTGHTAGPEASPEAEEGLLGRRRWAVAHSMYKDTHSKHPGKHNYYY